MSEQEYYETLKSITPSDYDMDMLDLCSRQNACDCPGGEWMDVAIATARAYIEDRDMAAEAKICK